LIPAENLVHEGVIGEPAVGRQTRPLDAVYAKRRRFRADQVRVHRIHAVLDQIRRPVPAIALKRT
jgi:hypothetical protein